MLSFLVSRIGYTIKGAFLFSIRGAMILGMIGLLLGGTVGLFTAGILGTLTFGLGVAIWVIPIGLVMGAISGALIGLLKSDFLYVYLRKLDNFFLTIIVLVTEDNPQIRVWQIGAVLGLMIEILISIFSDNMTSQETLIVAVVATISAFVYCICCYWYFNRMAI